MSFRVDFVNGRGQEELETVDCDGRHRFGHLLHDVDFDATQRRYVSLGLKNVGQIIERWDEGDLGHGKTPFPDVRVELWLGR